MLIDSRRKPVLNREWRYGGRVDRQNYLTRWQINCLLGYSSSSWRLSLTRCCFVGLNLAGNIRRDRLPAR